MSDIQRYTMNTGVAYGNSPWVAMDPDRDGKYVLYADHVAALDAEYARVTAMALDATRDSYELGIAKGAAEGVKTGRSGALADAVAAVEALYAERLASEILASEVISAIKGVSHE